MIENVFRSLRTLQYGMMSKTEQNVKVNVFSEDCKSENDEIMFFPVFLLKFFFFSFCDLRHAREPFLLLSLNHF